MKKHKRLLQLASLALNGRPLVSIDLAALDFANYRTGRIALSHPLAYEVFGQFEKVFALVYQQRHYIKQLHKYSRPSSRIYGERLLSILRERSKRTKRTWPGNYFKTVTVH